MSCHHLRQRLGDGRWECRDCGAVVLPRRSGIREIVESKQFPQSDIEPTEAHFSYSLGCEVTSRRDFAEKLKRITDPETNPEHVLRRTPKARQAYIDRCLEQGIVP